MALSFIGKPISLISHSDVRYRGILAGIDPVASTIQLSNVYSMGTESRRPPAQYIPPVQDPYEYIIFRASEVKDLAVDEPIPMASVHDDPAVVGVSAPMASAPQAMQPTYAQQTRPLQPQQPLQQRAPVAQSPALAQSAPGNPNPRHTANQARRTNSITSAAASLETVERALGDLRVSTVNAAPRNATANGGPKPRRNGAVNPPAVKPEVPTTDFDFQSSNARFDKAALAKSSGAKVESGSDSEVEEGKDKAEGTSEAKEGGKSPAYDPKASFFDLLSAGPVPAPANRTRGGRGGRGGRGSSLARTRREEERQRNVATFGEPGGVGLMGPGAYVGGWGGYGGGRGRGRGRNVVQGMA